MAITVVNHDGFDWYATGQHLLLYDVKSNTVDVITGGRNSGQRIRIGTTGSTTPACYLQKVVPSFTEFVIGGAFYFGGSELTGAVDSEVLSVKEGATYHLQLRVRGAASGNGHDLKVYVGSTQVATSAAYLTENVWHYLEIAGKIHDSTGYYRVWDNGTQVFDASGVDTQNAGTGTCDRYQLGFDTRSGNNQRFYLDDTYFATVTSGPDHLGDVREAAIAPSSAGNYTQFTPLSGSNWDNVNDATPDGDTTYNSSATVGNKDSFGMTTTPTTPSSIHSVKKVLYARKADAGARTMRSFVRSGTTDYEGSDFALSDSFQYKQEVMLTNPATAAAWTSNDIDNLELGYKVHA